MYELSAADGFVEINENLGDMIKYIANEPSVGLYYIQQHAQNAVPNVVRLKNNVMEKSHEVSLHTVDLEDSIAMTRTMKECGSLVIDEMNKDIKASLTLVSSKQPVRGVIPRRNSSCQMGGPSSWAPATWARSTVSDLDSMERSGSYFSSVFKSAKERAVSLTWPPPDLREAKENSGGGLPTAAEQQLLPPGSQSSAQSDVADELPISSQVETEVVEDGNVSTDEKTQVLPSPEIDFDEFRAKREALLEEWLTGSGSIL